MTSEYSTAAAWNPAFRPEKEDELTTRIGKSVVAVAQGSVESPTRDEPASEAQPVQEPGHVSTQSFARTVSHDIFWGEGEDDDVDQAWHSHNPASNFSTSEFNHRDSPSSSAQLSHKPADRVEGSSLGEAPIEQLVPESESTVAISSALVTERGELALPNGQDKREPDNFFGGDSVGEIDDDFFQTTKPADSLPPSVPIEQDSTELFEPSTSILMSSIGHQDSTDGPQDSEITAGGENLAALWEEALGEDGEEGDSSLDAFAFLGDDDEELLPDDEAGGSSIEVPAEEPRLNGHPQLLSHPSAVSSGNSSHGVINPYLPSQSDYSNAAGHSSSRGPLSNAYIPQSSSQNLGTFSATQPPPSGIPKGYNAITPMQAPALATAQSFAGKSKEGYTSPYDLPMDMSRSSRRKQTSQRPESQQSSQHFSTAPPPRSSSANFDHLAQTPVPLPHSQTSAPPNPNQYSSIRQPHNVASQPELRHASSATNFFEDLPVVVKSRPSSGAGRSLSQVRQSNPPGTSSSGQPPLVGQRTQNYHPQTNQAPPVSQPILQPYGLQQPERVDPYSQPSQTRTPSDSQTKLRYSPQPGLKEGKKVSARYAASPAAGSSNSPAASTVLPHQPRTSSPLAYPHRQSIAVPADANSSYHAARASPPHPQSQDDHTGSSTSHRYAPAKSTGSTAPPKPNTYAAAPTRTVSHQNKAAQSSTHLSSNLSGAAISAPPRRSQTQSPGAAIGGPRPSTQESDLYPRPASVHDLISPASAANPVHNLPVQPSQISRSFSQNLQYQVPTDGRQYDPLERWKGCPIFTWASSGSVLTCFPKDTPMIIGGQTVMQRGLGEVKTKNIREVLPLSEHIAKFPGPLKSKNKKKDVILWLSSRIEQLERQAPVFKNGLDTLNSDGEQLLLWKILRVLVEHDGALQGTSALDQLVRDLISPEIDAAPTEVGLQAASVNSLTGLSGSINIQALSHLKRLLLRGEREQAIWFAADQKLWAHAMLLSSTMSPELWKSVVREFVNKEVLSIGDNTESIAALYEVLAGNASESVDKLVHPSARLGVQMMTDVGKVSKDALEGLNKWRETLGLIIANRSPDDAAAILSIGRLLSSYRRTDAAHVCYLFAKGASTFGFFDDPQADFTLVGASELRDEFSDSRELDSILLSEIYEYALTLSPLTPALQLPHLHGYKLHHALVLAEHGYKIEAESYCSAIAAGMKSASKGAPLLNPALISSLDNLMEIIHNGPKDGSASWVSKPSMEKVSGAFSAKFYSFISGEDSDAPSVGSKDGADVGPFAKIAGSTPPITRNTSNTDLYSMNLKESNPTYLGPQPVSTAQSRYAPVAPSQADQQTLAKQNFNPYDPRPTYANELGTGGEVRAPADTSILNSSGPSPYSAVVGQTVTKTSSNSQNDMSTSAYRPSPYAPAARSSVELSSPSSVPHQPLHNDPVGYRPGTSTPDPPDSGQSLNNSYAPPANYEPPSYTPYVPDPESDEDPDKENMKADTKIEAEDNFVSTGSAAKSKAEKDKEAEEQFRKAAEADAKKSGQQPDKKGWLSGWFGKKDQNSLGGPIRAKLGEESSFVYDPDLKKWVNKKGGNSTPVASATPPPPKGPSARAVSGPPSSGGPPSRPPSSLNGPGGSSPSFPPRQESAPNLSHLSAVSGTSSPDRSESPAGLPALAPPSVDSSRPSSRPGTGISNASDIDDLLGPAGRSRKGGTVKKNKKGRGYVDVMAK